MADAMDVGDDCVRNSTDNGKLLEEREDKHTVTNGYGEDVHTSNDVVKRKLQSLKVNNIFSHSA